MTLKKIKKKNKSLKLIPYLAKVKKKKKLLKKYINEFKVLVSNLASNESWFVWNFITGKNNNFFLYNYQIEYIDILELLNTNSIYSKFTCNTRKFIFIENWNLYKKKNKTNFNFKKLYYQYRYYIEYKKKIF